MNKNKMHFPNNQDFASCFSFVVFAGMDCTIFRLDHCLTTTWYCLHFKSFCYNSSITT
jgi:hypothetical protein